MLRRAFILSGLVMTLCAGTALALPDRYHGTWAVSAADCLNDDSDGRMSVGRTGVDFFASAWRVTQWRAEGDRWVAQATVRDEGEDESATTTGQIALRLARDGRVLQVWLDGEGGERYVRCARDGGVRGVRVP